MALIAGVNEGKQLPATLPPSLVQLIWPAGFPGAQQPQATPVPEPSLTSSASSGTVSSISELTSQLGTSPKPRKLLIMPLLPSLLLVVL